MANLNANSGRTFFDQTDPTAAYPAGGALFVGSAVELSGGNLQNVTGAGTTFAGFLIQQPAASSDRALVRVRGTVLLTVAKATNWANTDVGANVYASDGNTFTLTSTSNQLIGKVLAIESGQGTTSAVVRVAFKGVQVP